MYKDEREFVGDKQSIVDVKATDEHGSIYQIEIQLATYPALSSRILYTWSSVYHSQMLEGDNYKKLKPVISIWILNFNLFENMEECHLPFTVYNQKHQLTLSNQLAIHLLQLPKWKQENVKNEKDRWLYLFKEGKNIDSNNPPKTLDTKEMKQVMTILNHFSENQKNYLLYQSRLDAIFQHNTIMDDLKEKTIEKEQAEREAEQAVKEAELAQKKAEHQTKQLAAKLRELGINPNDIQ
ncbi:Rpn family recombination-promoting nuclease/putative transposase [Candidatus Halobeggiatoa sp. HSG11]|nr:Rpn family recombination-promoting nuclease/putative transposase [Candidatus Halobeggiatoa sp. HSG11]